MISFLPELRVTPAAPLSPATALPAQAGRDGRGPGGGTLDFAGLLDAAMPAQVAIAPEANEPETALPALPTLPSELPVAPLKVGMTLPESGTSLPLAEPVMLVPAPHAHAELHITEEAGDSEPAAPIEDSEVDDPFAVQALVLPVPVAALAPVPAESPPVPSVALAAAASTGRAASPVAAQTVPRVVLAPRAPVLTLAPVTAEAPASAGEGADPSAMIDALSDSAPVPTATSAAPANPSPVAAATPTPLQTAAIEQRPEPRSSDTNQESTIAQVGEIREALRSTRPEMTVRHAEFGMVSLRIEGTAAAAHDWRAVLASRDPGFVPAVQAALAERAIAASADTASSGSQTGSGGGSGASSDRPYGFSQGASQGSSQPYLEHSGKRDEGAQQHQRQQQSRADEAALAAAPEAGPADARERGLFA